MERVKSIVIPEKKCVNVHQDATEFSKFMRTQRNLIGCLCLVVNLLLLVDRIHVYKEYVKIEMKNPINVYAIQDLLVKDVIHHLISAIHIHVSNH